MSLTLRPMTDTEISGWIDAARDAYAMERIKAGEPEELARRTTTAEYASYFPDGHPAPRHQLRILEQDGARVGFIWTGPHPRRQDTPDTAWLYDIEIDEDRRGRDSLSWPQRGGATSARSDTAGTRVTARA